MIVFISFQAVFFSFLSNLKSHPYETLETLILLKYQAKHILRFTQSKISLYTFVVLEKKLYYL